MTDNTIGRLVAAAGTGAQIPALDLVPASAENGPDPDRATGELGLTIDSSNATVIFAVTNAA